MQYGIVFWLVCVMFSVWMALYLEELIAKKEKENLEKFFREMEEKRRQKLNVR